MCAELPAPHSVHPSSNIIQCADDTSVMELRTRLRDCLWCSENNLVLHTTRTMELIVDYRWRKAELQLCGEGPGRLSELHSCFKEDAPGQGIINTVENIIHCPFSSLEDRHSSLCLKRAHNTLEYPSHPKHFLFELLLLARWFRDRF